MQENVVGKKATILYWPQRVRDAIVSPIKNKQSM